MKTLRKPPILLAFYSTIPIFFGYIPLGIAYGLLFKNLGYPWIFATLTGVFVFAGSAQFISIGLLANHASLNEVFLTILFLNLRHIFYGFSLIRRYQTTLLKKLYLIFSLTDETYSLLTVNQLSNKDEDQRYCLYVSVLNQTYWVLGCTLGALLGEFIRFNTKGLDFALTALFVVLTVEQAKKVRRVFPFAIALFSTILAILIYKPQMLFVALAISCTLIGISSQWEAKKNV